MPTIDSITSELQAIEQELARRNFIYDPIAWNKAKLHDSLWTGQQAILRAIATHPRVAVATCHGVGKSFSAAAVTAWWLDSHRPGEAFVVTTAPTAPQVKVILWKEIGRVHQRGELRGRVNQTEWIMKVGDKEETVAMGRKPNDYSPTAFQGIHAPFVLVIVDEANGVRGNLWGAIDSLLINDGSKMLCIGNPDDPAGEFYESCKPNSGWAVIHINAFSTPNFTGESIPQSVKEQLIGPAYVERNRRKWAPRWTWEAPEPLTFDQEGTPRPQPGLRCIPPVDGKLEDTHPFWQSKILGQFPVQAGEGSLIPLSWIRAAQERNLQPSKPYEFGLDIGASEDGDPSCLGWRRGPVFRILYEERQPDTMKTLGRMLQYLHNQVYKASIVKIDYVGVGRGVVDRALELNEPVLPISVSMVSTNPIEFADLLSELWWSVRGLFERGEIDIDEDDEDLASELLMVRWEPNSKGQTKITYVDGPSPNRADALMLTFAPVKATSTLGSVETINRPSPWIGFGDFTSRVRSRWRI